MRIPPTLKRTFSLYFVQVLNLFLAWVITKLNVTYLTIPEYGQYSFFITAINTIYIFFTFGLTESTSRLIALTEKEKNYRKILAASLLIAFFSYLIFSLVFWSSHWFVDSVFNVPISSLISIFFPLAGVYIFFDLWQKILRGKGNISGLAWFLATPRICYIILLVLLIFFDQFFLETTTLFHLAAYVLIVILFIVLEKPDFRQIKSSFSNLGTEIRRFGVHIYWSEIVNVVLYQSDKLIIALFLSAEQLAFYTLAFVITGPLALFSTSLSTTLYRGFTREKYIGRKILSLNILWIVLTTIILILFRKWIVLILFSDKYVPSLEVFPILAVAFAFAGIGKLYTIYLTAQGNGKAVRNISVSIVTLNLISNFIIIPRFGIMGAAFVRLATYIFDLILLIYYYSRHKRKFDNSIETKSSSK